MQMVKTKKVITSVFALLLASLCLLTLFGNTTEKVGAANSSSLSAGAQEMLNVKKKVQFGSDGNLTILIMSDIQSTLPVEQKTLDFIEKMVDKEKPDLVILAGDNDNGGGGIDYQKYIATITESMNKRQIPWCQVFGNHENGAYNWDNGTNKAELELIYESFEYNVSKGSKVNVYGDTNYVVPIFKYNSNEIGFNVFCLDSHDYMNKWKEAKTIESTCFLSRAIYSEQATHIYDVIHFDQIKWYWDMSTELEQYNGSKIPAMIVQHIPLIEWDYVYGNQEATGMTGTRGEGICAPQINSGLFWACLERGDVVAIFSGHDHINDFCGTFAGIVLGYCGGTGFHEYGMKSGGVEYRTGRVVKINQNNARNIETYVVYSNKI